MELRQQADDILSVRRITMSLFTFFIASARHTAEFVGPTRPVRMRALNWRLQVYRLAANCFRRPGALRGPEVRLSENPEMMGQVSERVLVWPLLTVAAGRLSGLVGRPGGRERQAVTSWQLVCAESIYVRLLV